MRIGRSHDRPRWQRRHSLAALLLFATALRLLLLHANLEQNADLYTQPAEAVRAEVADAAEPHMFFGMELSNIACAFVCSGQGFSSPFGGATGPTGWGAPGLVAPYIVGFSLFGCFTLGSYLFAWGVMLAASLATLLIVERIGSRVFADERAGMAAAALFAVAPFDAWAFRVKDAMDLNLPALALAGLLLATVRFGSSGSRRDAVWLGVATAVAVLVNPVLLLAAMLPLVVQVAAGRVSIPRAVLALALAATLVAPYLVVQRLWLGRFVFVKSNAPFEIYFGNTEASRGVLRPDAFARHHPSQSAAAFARYRELGEAAFVAERYADFRASTSATELVQNSARRFVGFFFAAEVRPWDQSKLRMLAKRALWAWLGGVFVVFLAWRRLRLAPAETSLFLAALAYAAPFMITGLMERYRVVIAPAAIVLQARLLIAVADAAARRWRLTRTEG